MKIRRLLVANRSEIARRVIRTAHRMGLQTVAVYSDADARALHVSEATTAYPLGGSASTDSYLRIDKLIAAARATGAGAVHPGYGFLSENADFAQAVIDAGLLWVGPPPQAIRALGSKSSAKQIAQARGVPCLPGYQGEDQTDQRFAAEAGRGAGPRPGAGPADQSPLSRGLPAPPPVPRGLRSDSIPGPQRRRTARCPCTGRAACAGAVRVGAIYASAGEHRTELPCPFARPLRLLHRGRVLALQVREQADGTLEVEQGGQTHVMKRPAGVRVRMDSGAWHVQVGPLDLVVEDVSFQPAANGSSAASANELRAPFNGKVIAVKAQPGSIVERGDTLLVLESMKLEHVLAASRDGVVKAVHVEQGQQAATSQVLVTFEAAA